MSYIHVYNRCTKEKIYVIFSLFLIAYLIYHLTSLNQQILSNSSIIGTKYDISKDSVTETYNRYNKTPKDTSFKVNKNGIRTILYWNTFFGLTNMGFGTGDNIFQNCPSSNCYATSDKNTMPIDKFDALLFHGVQYSSQQDGLPKPRSLNQKYIFYSLESPYNTHFDKSVNKDFYNWTMTYRRDSDIHAPYNIIQKQKTNYSIPEMKYINNKKDKVAWMVSNCNTKGTERRMKYVKELSKYIPVHIYGACGNYSCPLENTNISPERCYKMLEENYKYYLSFENTMCADYVTEKVFNILKHNIIPIALGNSDYTKITPYKSVINANDFDSPKNLANYLYELESDYSKYVEYFEWKKNFVVKSREEYTLCQLCEMLNKPIQYSSYSDIEDWFYGFKCYF